MLRGGSLDLPRIRALEGRLEDVENDLQSLADNLIYAAGAFDVALQESDLRTSGHRKAIATADDNFTKVLEVLKTNAEGTSAAFSRQLAFLKDLMCQAEQVPSGCLNKRAKFSSDLILRINSSVDPVLGFPDLSPLLDPNAARPQPYPPLRMGRGASSFLPSEQLQQQTQAPRLPRSADRNQYNYYDPSTQNQGKISFNSKQYVFYISTSSKLRNFLQVIKIRKELKSPVEQSLTKLKLESFSNLSSHCQFP